MQVRIGLFVLVVPRHEDVGAVAGERRKRRGRMAPGHHEHPRAGGAVAAGELELFEGPADRVRAIALRLDDEGAAGVGALRGEPQDLVALFAVRLRADGLRGRVRLDGAPCTARCTNRSTASS